MCLLKVLFIVLLNAAEPFRHMRLLKREKSCDKLQSERGREMAFIFGVFFGWLYYCLFKYNKY